MKIGVASGCFDILHPTHILFLEKCKRECDKLIVLIDSDELILKTKSNYPLFNEHDRLLIIKSLKVVDEAFVFNSMIDYKLFIENLINSEDNIFVIKNRKNFPSSSEISLLEITNTKTIIIQDVNRFSSSTQIKEFLRSK